ncbi:MAG: hypothetical protein FWD85_04860 [Microbacteriaceae bacterium]|nr:hypothetical protein [Microbacteriaceae bacterium]MCL2794621.1 hypothetical protein [Microbacteriaceae bacterium]
MRIPRRASLALAVLLAAGVVLTACTPADPGTHSTRSASPSPTPIFASDAEALAAAVAVYKKFEAATDAIGHDGGANPERIKPYLSASGYAFELKNFQKLQTEHVHGVGTTVLNNAVLQSRDETRGWATVTIYVCEDLSAVDRIGPDGKSTINSDRGNFVAYEAILQGQSADSLLIQSNTFWSGGGICKL